MSKATIRLATHWHAYFLLPLFLAACLGVGVLFGKVGAIGPCIAIGACMLTLLVLYRQNELLCIALLAIHLYIDWYIAYDVLSILLLLLLLPILYVRRTLRYPWVTPRMPWLWAIFLTLTLFPAVRGALTLRDLLIYYPNVILGALLFFVLGSLMTRSAQGLRTFFALLALFGCAIALHTFIQARFHVTLLALPRVEAYISAQGNYQLSSDASILRVGSFFIDPNWDGTFLAMLFFVPLGLFITSTTIPQKLLYAVETASILIGLLFTFSAGASISLVVGMLVFIVLAGSIRARIQVISLALLLLTIGWIGFSSQLVLLIQHGSDPAELLLRNGVWQTALRVIQAYPLTGVGLGHTAYLQYAEHFRVPEQFIPLDHPHNSFLEWAAMAGVPVLLVFLSLLVTLLWHALRTWQACEPHTRTLLGAGIAAVVVLSFNSWSIDGWTLMPLAAVGWCMLGATSSPLPTTFSHKRKV